VFLDLARVLSRIIGSRTITSSLMLSFLGKPIIRGCRSGTPTLAAQPLPRERRGAGV